MFKSKREKYYLDEGIILVGVKGGHKRTGAGGVVTKRQDALTCRTCFALVAKNHLETHILTHSQKPIVKGK